MAATLRPVGKLGIAEVELQSHDDDRGVLVPLPLSAFPFNPANYFYVTGVPAAVTRGEHAHRRAQQLLWPLRGAWKIRFTSREGVSEEKTYLPNHTAVYVPPMVWIQFWSEGQEGGLMVMSSEPYNKAEYITSWEEFRSRHDVPAPALAPARKVEAAPYAPKQYKCHVPGFHSRQLRA